MTALMPRGVRWLEVGAILALFLVIQVSANETDLTTSSDCYYNYNHYSEGDRILTNEPCLNCTCHNKMLMCYLKVCPFTKPIGQDCTIEKREDQCCPIITCPEVPVELDHSSAQSTDLAMHQNHGCSIDGSFYPEGAQIPGNPKKPCELCYCIRNMTSCVMQECTLHVDGCRPIYNKGVCCPVRYDCAHDDEIPLMLEDQTTTTEAPSQGFIITTTSAPVQSTDCYHNNERYIDGESIDTDQPCEHCYCMRGDIVCAVQECKPLEMHGKNCTARLPGPGECCPQVYECDSDVQTTTLFEENMAATTLGYRGDDSVLTVTHGASLSDEHIGKDAITTEANIVDITSQRIDESENEIHDKDYHDQMIAKPARTNFTDQQLPGALDSEDSTTMLNKLDDVAATTILSESGPISDVQITTILPIAGHSQMPETQSNENEGILSNLYTTIKSIVDFTTTSSLDERSTQKPPKFDDDTFLSNVIPGEGDCLDSGITYANNTNVPARSACEESCVCHNSIVHCEKVKCAPMPPNAENCKIHQEEGLCCPSYHCESMEFSTGPTPTHPAESQVIDRDESTTLSQKSDIEAQTNAVDSKLDSTTIPSVQPPISSKLDDTYEIKPEEAITVGDKLEKETAAPEMETATPAKIHGEMPNEEQRMQTKQPANNEIITEAAATNKPEAEITTQTEIAERIESSEQPERAQTTTAKSLDGLPQEITTTQLPLRDEVKPEQVTDAVVEKLNDESIPVTPADAELTTQSSIEEVASTTKSKSESAISTEEELAEEQKPEEVVTTESSFSQTSKPQDDSSTEQPIVQQEGEKQEELDTTESSANDKVQPENEISTEQQPTEQPIERQKQDELATTAAPLEQPASPQEEQLHEEPVTTDKSFEQKFRPEDDQSEGEKQEEIATTAQPSGEEVQPQNEISTEKQTEMEKLDEQISTEGPSDQKDSIEPIGTTEGLLEKDVTTEKYNQFPESPSSTEQAEKQPIVPSEETTTIKLAEEEPIESITSRFSEAESSENQTPISTESLTSSTEKQLEQEYTEKPMDNLIPDSSTEQQKQPEEISTEKQIESTEKFEDKSVTTEKAAPLEEEAIDETLPQTTVSAIESKPADELQKADAETTSEPKPIAQEPIATEKQPEYNEIASELPIEDHHTEKEFIAPTTEGQSLPSQEADAQKSTEKVELATTERVSFEEQTTLSTSKLNSGDVNPVDFKIDEVEKQEFDVTTEKLQQPEISSTEKQQIVTEQPAEKYDEKVTQASSGLEEKEQVTTENQYVEATTTYLFPSKQEDLEVITEEIVTSKQEDLELTTARREESKEEATTLSSKPELHQIEEKTETKLELEPSTQAPSDSEASTSSVKETPISANVEEIPRETTAAPIAEEKQTTISMSEQSEQTTFSAIVEKSTETSEIKEQEPIPSTQQPARAELESENQMHIADEKQPELQESSITTEGLPKQEDQAIQTSTASGEEQMISETTEKSQQPNIIENDATPSESPKDEQPIIESVTTEQNIIDITTMLSKIHEDATTQKSEQPHESPLTEQAQQQTEQPQQQTEQPQPQTEQSESTSVPAKQDENNESEPTEKIVTTEQSIISLEKEVSTQGSPQPADIEVTTIADQKPIEQDERIQETPNELTTLQPQYEEKTQRIESSSIESVQTTLKPATNEQTTQYEMEKSTQSNTKEKDASIESSTSQNEQAPSEPESTEREENAADRTTEAPVKLADPSIPQEPELSSEIVTTERYESVPTDELSSTKPSLFDGTTIKSVVELLTTLHPREPAIEQQESEITTAQSIDNRINSESSSVSSQFESYTTESAVKETSDEPSQQIFAMPPESSNKIPLIREPSHDEITTKLAESFDTTTLPSILLTSSHTERISDSTTIKNTQNEIMETTVQPQQQQQQQQQQTITETPQPADISGAQSPETESQPPFAQPGFDSGYGNVPSQYPDEEYGDEEEPTIFGPGTCRYGGKLYVSAQQIPRDDPCDFCFCFRSDIICLQQSCPPPISGCHEEPIQGFCCPRYECPVSMGLVLNSTTTTTTTLPPYLSHFQRNTGKLTRSGCQIQGMTYKIGERVTTASGPCIDCICGGDGQMKCDPKVCTPEPMLRQMIASAKRR